MAELRVLRTVCPHDCPDQCSILATVDAGERLLQVAGDPGNPFTAGFLCGKVNRYPERVHSSERLLTPLRRTGAKGSGAFAPISWDAALDEIATRWQALIREHGGQALLGYAYGGNMGLVSRNIIRPLFHALGATGMLTGTVCDTAAAAGWEYTAGEAAGTDPESVSGSDFILCWGTNLATTNVHLVPFVDLARRRGAPLIVVDPYRSRTARRADWHVAPRLGTDAALALGLMHVLVRDGLHDAAYLSAHGVGFAAFAEQVLPEYPPERVAAITGVSASDIEALAMAYGRARAPFLRLGTGISRHAGGGMAVRTVACLPAVVGAWTRSGGGCLMETAPAWGFDYDAIRRPDFQPGPGRTVNQSQLGRALLELKDPPIMALFVASTNPAVSCPDQSRVAVGLARDDLFTVVHDAFLTDTARLADIVLPAATSFEQEDLYRSYGSYYVQHGPPVLAPLGEARSNLHLVQALARRLGLTDPFFARTEREHMQALLAGATGPTADLRLAELIGGGPVKLPYPGGGPERTHFYSAAMAAAGLPAYPVWAPDPEPAPVAYPLRLLTAPGHHQHHTSFAAVAALQRQEGAPRCLLHPDDAAARNIADGEAVVLYNEKGSLGLHVHVTTDVPPGLVVVEGHRSRSRYLSGGPLNVLTGDRLADLGEGATYQNTWVEVGRA